MLKQNKKWKNEKGMALIVAILVTTALVSVGTLAMMMTNTEIDISKNDRFGKEAFFFTDGGNGIATKIIKDVYWEYEIDTTEYSGITVNSNVINEIFNYVANDGNVDTPDNNPDITFNMNGKSINTDIDFRFKQQRPGGSLLTHMGYEGTGVNKQCSVLSYLDTDHAGRAAVSSSRIEAAYERID